MNRPIPKSFEDESEEGKQGTIDDETRASSVDVRAIFVGGCSKCLSSFPLFTFFGIELFEGITSRGLVGLKEARGKTSPGTGSPAFVAKRTGTRWGRGKAETGIAKGFGLFEKVEEGVWRDILTGFLPERR